MTGVTKEIINIGIAIISMLQFRKRGMAQSVMEQN